MKNQASVSLIAMLVIGCNSDVKQSDTATVGDPATGGMASMPGMGATGVSGTAAMIADMKAKLADIEKLERDSLEMVVQDHRAKAAALLSEMNREMASMQMQADAGWSATADSVRKDLVAIPEAKGEALKALMGAHITRLLRLIGMHEDMMKH